MSNRRQHYRLQPSHAERIEIALIAADLPADPVRLLDLSAAGAGLELPEGAHGAMQTDQEVTLRVSSDKLLAPIDLRGLVCHVDERAPRPRVGMRFVDWREHRALLHSELRSLFNERAAYRASPAPNRRVRVEVQTPGGRRIGRLRDLSVTGVGVELEDLGGAVTGDAVGVTVLLPQPYGIVVALAEVRHVQTRERRPVMGLFLVTDRREEARLQREIAPWVMARQRAVAQTGDRA
jgi:c-di-GMP-binding flagellar brake protein YcgR